MMRRGVTLIELLVVVSIVILLTAVAMPVVNHAAKDRRGREAARMVSVYLGSARNRALETGRPCGVRIDRVANRPEAGIVLQQVEVPPPYAGDSIDATVTVQIMGGSSGSSARLKLNFNPPLNSNLVRPGDWIQLGDKGLMYQLRALDEIEVNLAQGISLPWQWPASGQQLGPPSSPMIYRILRQPVKGGAQPLQLPRGAVIDLADSGTDSGGTLAPSGTSDATPVVIMFSGNGTLEGVYVWGVGQVVIEPIYLLVGKRERIPAGAAEDGLANRRDGTNFWVAIHPQGLITTAQVVPSDNLAESRRLAREGLATGGR
jgi:type II secretory pathway pseudopilin PulG